MTETTYLLDYFRTLRPGEPYRLLPFGVLYKGGRRIEITPALAARFRLPHFRPPIKLGSHGDETPAGGLIVGLEVREDGLYAIPEFNDNGTAALTQGHYYYHSPEVIWEGGYEDPTTGQVIAGPLIVGDALLHTPHLGEGAALYHVEEMNTMSEANDTVTMPAGLLERILGWFNANPNIEAGEIAAAPDADAFAAEVATLQAERDELSARIEAMEAARTAQARVAHFASELAETPVGEDGELHALLAAMDEETAAALVQRFAALSEQARVAALTQELGNSGTVASDDPLAVLNREASDLAARDGIAYSAAVARIANERPELYRAAYPRRTQEE